MNKNDIVTLIRINFWANDRILSACERILTHKFRHLHNPYSGWGSLRDILAHTLDTEYGWCSVLQALDADAILKVDDFAGVAALKFFGTLNALLGLIILPDWTMRTLTSGTVIIP